MGNMLYRDHIHIYIYRDYIRLFPTGKTVGPGTFVNLRSHMGGCQHYGPLLGRCCILIGISKGTIMLTTAHMGIDQSPGAKRAMRKNDSPHVKLPL